jgi:ligand-binding sensor domain-containing protein/anti-sigma regulatory factor (Ser/Thr protein kinase)
MRFIAFVLLSLITAFTGYSQQAKYTAFTVNDGLPSNYIYRCVEDNRGFLWVATDAGIARFDGKHFQVFTTRDGLPDNEVLAVFRENNGRIWVNCFKQSPAYFDEAQNRFINARGDSNLAKIKEGTLIMNFFPLQHGGMMFVNEAGTYIIRDNKLTAYNSFLVRENEDGTTLKAGSRLMDTATRLSGEKIYYAKEDIYADSITVGKFYPASGLMRGLDDGKYYLFNNNTGKCFIYSEINVNPLRLRIDSFSVPERFFYFTFTAAYLSIYSNTGKIYVFDKQTLQLQSVIHGPYFPNALYNDSKGNIWVSTIDKGLLLYKKNRFATVKMPEGFTNTHFLSIARKADGGLLAGNYYGEIVEARGKTVKINTIPRGISIARQRKILLSQKKIFSFSETGIYVNYTKPITTTFSRIYSAKTAINYDDSTIIFGLWSGLQKLNTVTEKVSFVYPISKRVTAVAKAGDGIIYFGSTDGLYKYDITKDSGKALTLNHPLLSERIAALCTTPDGLLWVATSGSGVVAVKDDKVFIHIAEKDGLISNLSRSITAGRQGQVWLGTAGGINIINYSFRNGNLGYAIQNLSVNDGLSSNIINEMLYENDTIYAATGDGISVIPAGISVPKFDIPVQLVRMRINQRDTVISTHYSLGFKQQNILMQFAGIELNGHFKNLQYTLDNNKNWVDLIENTLTLQLSSGDHNVQVRAVDVNGNISDKVLIIRFAIARPFWKSFWFWIIVAVLLQFIVVYLVNRWQKKRKEAKLAREIAGVQTAALEQQAFTSLMNPHFMFNALNSIQHYINRQDRQNANRYLSDFASLIRKNFEAAQQSFIPLEQELENIKIYLRLEQMRFADRFSYRITIAENLDTEDWMIPTMMLQPFLENALLHGIMPSAIKGELTIDLGEQGKNLLITIIDNGIGMVNSQALKENSGHRSRGMELIEKRIAALTRFGMQPVTIHVSPAFADEKNSGNKIVLCIPAGLYEAWLKAKQQ